MEHKSKVEQIVIVPEVTTAEQARALSPNPQRPSLREPQERLAASVQKREANARVTRSGGNADLTVISGCLCLGLRHLF